MASRACFPFGAIEIAGAAMLSVFAVGWLLDAAGFHPCGFDARPTLQCVAAETVMYVFFATFLAGFLVCAAAVPTALWRLWRQQETRNIRHYVGFGLGLLILGITTVMLATMLHSSLMAERLQSNSAIDSDIFSAPLRAPINARHCGR